MSFEQLINLQTLAHILTVLWMTLTTVVIWISMKRIDDLEDNQIEEEEEEKTSNKVGRKEKSYDK